MKYDKNTEESELITALQNGSEAAFNELYHRYHKLIFFVANRTCHNEADAQDITQDTLLTIKEHAGDIRNPKYFRLWVYRIISSKCKNMFYKNRRIMNTNEDDYFSNHMIEERREFIPHQDMHFKSDQEVINHLIDQLSEGQRLVMIMFYMEQFSIHEISEVLEIPEGTVKSRLSTARNTLQQKVLQYEKDTKQRLDFHNLTQAIPLALSASLAKCIAPTIPFIKSNPITSTLQNVTSFIGTHIVSSIMIAGVVIGGGYLVKEYVDTSLSKPENIQHLASDKPVSGMEFHPIALEDETIDTPKKGFYALQLSACCEKDIEDMSDEQLQAMKPLYDEMKKNGGVYYAHLIEIGWAKAFEQKVK